MSCLLEEFLSIESVSTVLEWMHYNEPTEDEEEEWNDDWADWKEDVEESVSIIEQFDWLDECLINISPCTEFLAIAFQNKLAIFSKKEIHGESSYLCTWKGIVGKEESDDISALLILPLFARKYDYPSVDWTAIAVGFTSGHTCFYSETGNLLMTIQYNRSPVISFSCNTFCSFGLHRRKNVAFLPDFCIAHKDCTLVLLDDQDLWVTLQAYKAKVAKEKAGVRDLPEPKALEYRKNDFTKVGKLESCQYAGYVDYCSLDSILHSSKETGFDQTFNGISLARREVLVGGVAPFYGQVSRITEANMQRKFDMAGLTADIKKELKNSVKNIAKYYTSMLYTPVETLPVDQPNDTLPMRFTLTDKRRSCSSIVISPSRNLAAVTDDFGRVMVIDVQLGVVVRMWKGYRNAQCAWQDVIGEFRGIKRLITYLIIYAPFRGILEVWLPQESSKVGAFNVPKTSRLLYNRHSMIGLEKNVEYQGQLVQTVLLDRTGSLETLKIPFFLGFRGITSMHERDVHLLKSMRQALRKKNPEEFIKLVSVMESKVMRTEALNLILDPDLTTLTVAETVVEILTRFDEATDEQQPDEAESVLEAYHGAMLKVKQILSLYQSLLKLHGDSHTVEVEENLQEYLASCLIMTVDETKEYLKDLKHFQSKEKDDDTLSFSEFMICIVPGPTNSGIVSLEIAPTSSERLRRLVRFVFMWPFSLYKFKLFMDIIWQGGLETKNLFDLFFEHWSQVVAMDTRSIASLSSIITFLAVCTGDRPHAGISDIWSTLNSRIQEWPKAAIAYLIAVICRGVETHFRAYYLQSDVPRPGHAHKDTKTICQELFALISDTDRSVTSLDEWEGLSTQMVEWTLLRDRLEKLKHVQQLFLYTSEDCPDLSLKCVALKGQGYLSELVATFLKTTDCRDGDFFCTIQENLVNGKQQSEAIECLVEIMACFPNATSVDVLLMNLAWELGVDWSRDLKNMCVLRRMSDVLKSIANSHYTKGICLMLWRTRFVAHVQYIATTLDKSDRLPAYESPVGEDQMPEHCFVLFLVECRTLLWAMAVAMGQCRGDPEKTEIARDSFWQIDRPSLLSLALTETEPVPSLVLLHVQMVLTMKLMMECNVTSWVLSKLFTELDREYLFQPLDSMDHADNARVPKLVASYRENFLDDLVNAVVSSYSDRNSRSEESVQMFADIKDLCKEWFESDSIAEIAHYIEMLSSGFDQVPLLEEVKNEALAKKMLSVVGERLRYHFNASYGSDVASHFNMDSRNWVKDVQNCRKLRNPKCSFKDIATLLDKTKAFMPPDTRHTNYQTMINHLSISVQSLCRTSLARQIQTEIEQSRL